MPASKQTIENVRHNLQLDENLHQHKKGWIIQKTGWAVLYAGLILAALGLFGTGVMSYRTQARNGNSIKYERFLRYESEAEMTFDIAEVEDTITLQIPQYYMEYIHLQSITPLPLGNQTIDGQTTYFFKGRGTASIHCGLMAKKAGSVTSTIVVNKTPFTITHQIYP
ncbi:hypothetical protein [Niastella populi]|uniref:Uncharacterized protein n=1 Tax=Niastella populi TaxID=550983 RepID=A0A1V9FVA2_9BACT|nr:hypothetical protein [Niastella populi]OQP62250.1 hypothetical protein A4R26_18425 [Niastella populi]